MALITSISQAAFVEFYFLFFCVLCLVTTKSTLWCVQIQGSNGN